MMTNSRGRTTTAVLAIILATIVFAFIVIGFISSVGPQTPDQPLVPPLKARVSFDGEYFNVSSNDRFDWTDCIFAINPLSPTGGFTLSVPLVRASGLVRLDNAQFAQSDGRRFNLLLYKPSEFSVQCMTPAGIASYAGSFR